MIRLKDFDYSETQINSKWLGTKPATLYDIKKTEDRLKNILPQDYKDFLLTTNGFHAFSHIDPGFCSIDKIDFLKNIDPELFDIWNQSEMMMLVNYRIALNAHLNGFPFAFFAVIILY